MAAVAHPRHNIHSSLIVSQSDEPLGLRASETVHLGPPRTCKHWHLGLLAYNSGRLLRLEEKNLGQTIQLATWIHNLKLTKVSQINTRQTDRGNKP